MTHQGYSNAFFSYFNFPCPPSIVGKRLVPLPRTLGEQLKIPRSFSSRLSMLGGSLR